MRKLGMIITTAIIGLFVFIGCSQDEDFSMQKDEGRLNVLLTDAPFPIDLIDKAYVTIDKVEIRQQFATDSTGVEVKDSFVVIAEGEAQYNLLDLTNGITEQIGSANLEAGYYDLIRLHVTDASIVLNDGADFDLKVPSGSASGLKVRIDPAIHIEAGQTSDVLLDFDVSKSFVMRGNMNNLQGFIFKPVVRGVYMKAAGSIEGTVTDTSATGIENVMVKVWNNEEVEEVEEDGDDEESMIVGILDDNDEDDEYLISAFTDSLGHYKFIGLTEGSYVLTFEHEGYTTFTTDVIEVEQDSSTELNVDLLME